MDRKSRVDALGAAVLITFSVLLGLNQALVKLGSRATPAQKTVDLRWQSAARNPLRSAVFSRVLSAVHGFGLHNRFPGLHAVLYTAILGGTRRSFSASR